MFIRGKYGMAAGGNRYNLKIMVKEAVGLLSTMVYNNINSTNNNLGGI